MSNIDAVKKVMMYQNDKTGFIKEPTVKEMADLVVLVLNSVKTIERAIESKRLDIDKKYAAPVEQALNKNQSETAAVLSWVTKEVNGLLALGESAVNQTTAQLETQVQQALANIRSGKDGIVTEAEIQRAADMALGMLELPDFDAMVSEAFTKNGEAIRNALELLSGDERYKVEIADVVGLQEMLSQLAAIRANGGGGIGKTQVYNFIRQAIDEGIITSGGVTTFTALTDAPNSYVGQAGKFPKVNATEDGLEFATVAGISETQTFTNKTISDTANTLGVTDSYDFIVYRSGGNTVAKKTSDGTTLSTNTDASVVLQAVVDQVDASTGTGGRIFVKPGTYAMASTVTIQGDNTSNSPEVSLHGSGVQATIFNPASGVNGFTISNRAKVSLRWFAIYVSGASDGIKVTNSSIGQRGCWQSEFKNIYINGYDSTHTGWGINAENFFRSVMENIEMNQVGNGMLLKAIDTSTGYNPGDSTFTRMFIELRNRAGGSAYQIDSPSTGDMNQMVFIMCEGYGGGTAQTGVLLSGASGNVNHTHWIGINLENFDTIIDIQSGRNNVFDLNYVVTRNATGTTYFKTSSNAYGNKISCKYMDTYTQSVVVVNDANTSIGQRNRFENIVMQGTATTLTFTRVDATYLYNIFDNVIGGNGVVENGNSSVSANAVTINATAGFFTDTTDITFGTSRTDITLTNKAIRSTSVVSCFMMSAPDANAMLVASCVPIDGSCTISIRNVGAGTQTSTYTMGFIVKQ